MSNKMINLLDSIIKCGDSTYKQKLNATYLLKKHYAIKRIVIEPPKKKPSLEKQLRQFEEMIYND